MQLYRSMYSRRPTDIRIDGSRRRRWPDGSDVELCRVCRVMDQLKSTTAQPIQDRVDLAGNKSPFAALRRSHNEHLWSWCPSGRVRSRSRCPDRQQHDVRFWTTSTTWLASAPTSYASYASSDVHWRRKLHTRLSGPCIQTRADYCNAPRCRSEVYLHEKLQCVLRAAARLVLQLPQSASRICFRHHASTVALARDARSHISSNCARSCSDASTDSHLGTCRTPATVHTHLAQIICDTWKISVSRGRKPRRYVRKDSISHRLLPGMHFQCTCATLVSRWTISKWNWKLTFFLWSPPPGDHVFCVRCARQRDNL